MPWRFCRNIQPPTNDRRAAARVYVSAVLRCANTDPDVTGRPSGAVPTITVEMGLTLNFFIGFYALNSSRFRACTPLTYEDLSMVGS